MTPEVTPTNEQIKAEARRRLSGVSTGTTLSDKVIEVMREGWTPPPSVDQDLLAYREWFANRLTFIGDRERAMAGHYDKCSNAQAYLAGARMATERERERAQDAKDDAPLSEVLADLRAIPGVTEGIEAFLTAKQEDLK